MLLKSATRRISKVSGKVPLRTILVVPFVIQIVATVGLTGWLSFRNGQKAVNDLATQLRNEITARIQQHLDTYLGTPHLINQINADAMRRGQLTLQNPSSERYLWQQIQLFNSVSWIYVSQAQQGEFLGITRIGSDRSLQIVVADESTNFRTHYYGTDQQGLRTTRLKVDPKRYDARTRPFYTAALQAGKSTWTEIYQDFSGAVGLLYISATQPVYDNGKLLGVVSADLSLGDINQFLSNLDIGRSGQTFIIDRTGSLVANSTTEPPFIVNNNREARRIKATESSDRLIRATAQHITRYFGNLSDITVRQQLDFSLDNQRQLVQVLPYKDQWGLDWLIVVVVPESDFMGQINANTRTTILLCLVALAVAIAIGLLSARWVIRPLLRLNTAAKELAKGNWEQTPIVERDDELGELAKSFNSMAKQLQESFATLEAQNVELQRLDKLKDEFLANTSHELRTPLSGIIGIAESLMDGATGQLNSETRRNLSLVVFSGRRLANLVNDILDFSKLRHNTLELQLKPVGMRSLAEVVLTLSQPLIGQKDLRLVNAISPELPPVYADENRLQQILHNLVGNAIKFSDTGTVELSARLIMGNELSLVSNPHLKITVSDTGIGIPEDKLDRIFESFEQADGTIARAYGGTGLGLAITKKLVELHGGEIKAESTVGVGSRFTFTLPVVGADLTDSFASQFPKIAQNSLIQDFGVSPQLANVWGSDVLVLDQQLIATHVERLATSNGQTFKILVVDDEPVNRQVFANYLSLDHYDVILASSGTEALQILESGLKPDLILLDVMMPHLTGYEITRKIRETWQVNELPIVLLSAKNQVSDLVVGLEAGANDYLTKPISKDELLARIKTHISLRQLQAENLRLAAELELTRQIQQMLLPKERELKSIAELDVAGYMEPAEVVGGDYYDVLQHKDGLKIGIGDVTGHGLESGVLMIMVQTAVRTLLETGESNPQQFLDVLNRTIYKNVQRMNSDKTLTLSVLDYQQGQLRLSGQHEEMIIVRSTGEVERIDTLDLGFPIGLEADISNFVAQVQVQLNPNDVVVLYTDGITEAENLTGVRYGIERLCQVVRLHKDANAAQIKQAVIEDLRQHIGEQTVYDDITLLVLKQK